jgi:hypothetical protein
MGGTLSTSSTQNFIDEVKVNDYSFAIDWLTLLQFVPDSDHPVVAVVAAQVVAVVEEAPVALLPFVRSLHSRRLLWHSQCIYRRTYEIKTRLDCTVIQRRIVSFTYQKRAL